MNNPSAPTDYPGVERFPAFSAFSGSMASPSTWSIQLPGYGSWLLTAFAWYTNANQSITRSYVVTWFRNDVSGSQTKNLSSSAALGAAVPATDGGSGAANTWTGLDLSAPSTSGVISATGSWSGGASLNPKLIVTGHRLFLASDFAR